MESAVRVTGDTHRAETAQSTWYRASAEAAVIFLVFFVVGGAPPPHVNETHYLAKAKHYWDPTYCPGDLFLDSADPHLTFYWALGWLTQFLSLPAVAWIGRVIAWAGLAAAWRRLSRTVVPAPWAAVLTAVLWTALMATTHFAGEWVVGGVEAKCFAYALVLAGLADVAAGRWGRPWIWFGAAAAFHVLVGAWAVLTGLVAAAMEPRGRRPSLFALVPGLLIGGLLSLPGLLPALALERSTDPGVVQEAARIYVFDRLPHHLAPLSLPAAELGRRLWGFGLLSLAFVLLWTWARRVAAESTPGRLSADDETAEAAEPSLRLDRIMRFAAVALACNAVGLTLEAALVDRPLLAARLLRYYWFRLADVAVPLAVALACGALVVELLRRRVVGGVAALAAALTAGGWFLANTMMERLEATAPPAAAKLDDFASWRAACEWVRDHTSGNALFLLPRAGHSFKWYAARADVANFKDVPQDAASVVQWRERCRELFPVVTEGDLETVHASPEQWGSPRVRALARKYGATHVLARSFPPLDLPRAYPPPGKAAESFYAVYETGVSREASGP